jgi:hypothetical protein
VEMLEVVGLIDAGKVGEESLLVSEMDEPGAGALEGSVGSGDVSAPGNEGQGSRPSPKLHDDPGLTAVLHPRVEEAAAAAQMRPQPFVVARVGEEQDSSEPSSSLDSAAARPITTCSTPPESPLPSRASMHTRRGVIACGSERQQLRVVLRDPPV